MSRQRARPKAALLAFGLALSGLAVGADIELVRETILERGVYADAKAIARMTDGGYVIAGSIPGIRAGWATKVDAKGNPQWRYVLPPEKPNPERSPPEITAVASMADGAALLCGFTATGPGPIAATSVAVLVQIDKSGNVVQKGKLYPRGDESYGSAIRKCVEWDDGFIAIGNGGRRKQALPEGKGDSLSERFYWVVALDRDLKVKWENKIPINLERVDNYSQVLVLPNHDVVFSATRRGKEILTEVVRFGPKGEVQAQRRLEGDFVLVPRVNPDSAVWLLGCHGGLRRGTLLRVGTGMCQ